MFLWFYSEKSSCLFPSCNIGRTITEEIVRLSTDPQQARKLNRLLVKLVSNKLSITLAIFRLDVITQSADDIFPHETCDNVVKLLARIS